MPKIRNIIIFILIACVFGFGYIYFTKSGQEPDANLVTVPGSPLPDATATTVPKAPGAAISAESFLPLLLSVKNIHLEDTLLSDPAFLALKDSSITLTPDGNEGRPNPFAKLGTDLAPAETVPPSPTVPNVPVPDPAAGESTSNPAQ